MNSSSLLNTARTAINSRKKHFDFSENETFRLLHNEIDGIRCDRYGSICWIYWYLNRPPAREDQYFSEKIAEMSSSKHWIMRVMKNRGADPGESALYSSGCPESWAAEENGIMYLLKSNQGLSPGLFLDQRSNRLKLLNNSKDKSVLNLFCYTGGFSLCAAKGGAGEIVQVDSSKATLAWAEENASLNGLNITESRCDDARSFLRFNIKKGRKFDIIICDPPSFARSKQGVFQIEKAIPELVTGCTEILNSGGELLFTTNYEKWNIRQLKKKIWSLVDPDIFNVSVNNTSLPDFSEKADERLMKGILIRKK